MSIEPVLVIVAVAIASVFVWLLVIESVLLVVAVAMASVFVLAVVVGWFSSSLP